VTAAVRALQTEDLHAVALEVVRCRQRTGLLAARRLLNALHSELRMAVTLQLADMVDVGAYVDPAAAAVLTPVRPAAVAGARADARAATELRDHLCAQDAWHAAVAAYDADPRAAVGTRVAEARRAACLVLDRGGWSSTRVGAHLGVHHTSVLAALGRTARSQGRRPPDCPGQLPLLASVRRQGGAR